MVLETTDALTDNMHVTVQFQWLPLLIDKLPDALVEALLGPGMAKFNELKRVSFGFIHYVLFILKLTTGFLSIASRRSKRR